LSAKTTTTFCSIQQDYYILFYMSRKG
jgi:hypothetical protein